MIDGVILGVFMAVLCVLLGAGAAEFYHTRQDNRDAQWANILQQQQAQINDLLERINDHSEPDPEVWQ